MVRAHVRPRGGAFHRRYRSSLHDLPLLTIDEMLDEVDSVSIEDVHGLASELYAGESLSTACVGRDEDRFKAAVAPVSETLGA